MKKHNFSAGPSILPEEVLEKSAQALLDFDDGLSLIEISHRSKAFVDVMENARILAIELLGLKGKGYNIARRTIVKYREQLEIPVARLRKEL